MRVDWTDLQCLIEVARTGSLLKASKALNMTQPTVNRKIKALEQSIGGDLIVTSKTGTVLTLLAEELLPSLKQMAEASSKIEKIARNEMDTQEGTVTLGTTDLLAAELISPMLGDFALAHPRITIELDCGLWQGAYDPLKTDILIGYSKPADIEADSQIIGHAHYCWYASRNYLERHGEPDFIGDLIGHPIVYHTAQKQQMENWPEEVLAFGKLAEPSMRIKTNSSAAFINAIRSGAGIGPMPTAVGVNYPELVPLRLERGVEGRIYMSVDRAVSRSIRVRIVKNWLTREVFNMDRVPELAQSFTHPRIAYNERRGADTVIDLRPLKVRH